MADTVTWIARFIHVFSGVMWVGGIFLWGMVVMPSVAKRVAAPARGPFMSVVLPRVARYFAIAGFVTIISGLWVMGLILDDFGAIFKQMGTTDWGRMLANGMSVAVLMLGIGIYIMMIVPKYLSAMANVTPGTPPPEGAAKLQKRIMILAMTNLTLGIIALGIMAWAVNLREFGVA